MIAFTKSRSRLIIILLYGAEHRSRISAAIEVDPPTLEVGVVDGL